MMFAQGSHALASLPCGAWHRFPVGGHWAVRGPRWLALLLGMRSSAAILAQVWFFQSKPFLYAFSQAPSSYIPYKI